MSDCTNLDSVSSLLDVTPGQDVLDPHIANFPSEQSFNLLAPLLLAHFEGYKPGETPESPDKSFNASEYGLSLPMITQKLLFSIRDTLDQAQDGRGIPTNQLLIYVLECLRNWRMFPVEEKYRKRTLKLLARDLSGLTNPPPPCPNIFPPLRPIKWIGRQDDPGHDLHEISFASCCNWSSENLFGPPASPETKDVTEVPESMGFRNGCSACRQPRSSLFPITSSYSGIFAPLGQVEIQQDAPDCRPCAPPDRQHVSRLASTKKITSPVFDENTPPVLTTKAAHVSAQRQGSRPLKTVSGIIPAIHAKSTRPGPSSRASALKSAASSSTVQANSVYYKTTQKPRREHAPVYLNSRSLPSVSSAYPITVKSKSHLVPAAHLSTVRSGKLEAKKSENTVKSKGHPVSSCPVVFSSSRARNL